ncbi:hypothetical protein C2S51_010415 [Perilla frutescens var. frutescens]|nr:hypothetical protein C2S51_010415 [Perilla frutescens var. frutescens]
MYAIEILPFITFPILISLLLLFSTYKSGKNKRLPPSPPKLPILGNLHQLSSLPHQDLHAMARKHGPLMLLHFGSVPVLIASSADAAGEIMKTHDLTFASRPEYKAFKKLLYGCKDVSFSPYGEYWRQMKSIFVLQLLSNKRVQSFRSIREEETSLFVRKIEESEGRHVNLSEMFREFTNDLICRSAFGSKFRESENGKELLRILEEFMALLGAICIGDFIPWLSWIDRVSGFDKKLDRVTKAMDDFLENLVQERIEASKGCHVLNKDGQNFFDIMLEIHNENKVGASITRESIKALLADVLSGGTDTISTTLEWAMTELLRHPAVLKTLQNEVREIAKDSNITDNDVIKMHYLKAVIKETLRYHPPLPLLAPRVASKDLTIKGYDISAGTVAMINVWTIGRDAAIWEDAEKFRPERFLESSIDFKGVDFELIPFGAGRRGCPGITYAVAAMEFLLANIVQKFNWKLGNGTQGVDLDTIEAPGVAVHRANPLFAVATY